MKNAKEKMNMATEEKFNQIYQTIVSENTEDMEIARGEARVENRHNMFVLAIIIIINIVFIKLIGDSLEALSAVLIFISMVKKYCSQIIMMILQRIKARTKFAPLLIFCRSGTA